MEALLDKPAQPRHDLCQTAIGLIHSVPPALQHVGCMWLEDGDERHRCGKTPRWTMGISLWWPRVYCEEHGQRILERYLRERERRFARRNKIVLG